MDTQSSNESQDTKALTFGERAVGIGFNPSANPRVQYLKEDAAHFIDRCDALRQESNDPEIKRMYSVAITESQTAQMWAVKAVTWNS